MPIYRGVGSSYDQYRVVDSNKGKPRQSANTLNYMTWLMDNLPSWKAYPKRSRGIICSTSLSYAGGYGQIYQIIPYDNAQIAVCPTIDVWESFEQPLDGMTVKDFNEWLEDLFYRFHTGVPTSWATLKKALQQVDAEFKNKSDNDGSLRAYDWYNPYNLLNPNKKIMKTLDTELSPTKNNFKLGINNLSKDKEVWIQGNAIMVNVDYVSDFYLPAVMNEI